MLPDGHVFKQTMRIYIKVTRWACL